MPSAAWLDQTTAALLDLDRELRALLRQPPARGCQLATHAATAPGPTGIRVATWQARILLRGAVSPLPQHRALRRAHAQLHIALQLFLARLPAVSTDPTDAAAIDLGVQLAAVLRAWLSAARWQQATRQAGVRGWTCPPPVAIGTILRPQSRRMETKPDHHEPLQLQLPFAA